MNINNRNGRYCRLAVDGRRRRRRKRLKIIDHVKRGETKEPWPCTERLEMSVVPDTCQSIRTPYDVGFDPFQVMTETLSMLIDTHPYSLCSSIYTHKLYTTVNNDFS